MECQIIIISKPRISVALFCSGYLSYPLFFAKREISVEVSTFRGSLFLGRSLLSGFANTLDISSLLSEVHYF